MQKREKRQFRAFFEHLNILLPLVLSYCKPKNGQKKPLGALVDTFVGAAEQCGHELRCTALTCKTDAKSLLAKT